MQEDHHKANVSFLTATLAKGFEMGLIPGVKMCSDCAFKVKADATDVCDVEAAEGAVTALSWGFDFSCHKECGEEGKLVPAGHLCAGFLYAKQYLDSKENITGNV